MYLVALVREIHQILKNGVSNVHWDKVLNASLFYLDRLIKLGAIWDILVSATEVEAYPLGATKIIFSTISCYQCFAPVSDVVEIVAPLSERRYHVISRVPVFRHLSSFHDPTSSAVSRLY